MTYSYRFSVHELPIEAVSPDAAKEFQALPGDGWTVLSWELATQRKAVVLWQRLVDDSETQP
jgi:hypothetical protein